MIKRYIIPIIFTIVIIVGISNDKTILSNPPPPDFSIQKYIPPYKTSSSGIALIKSCEGKRLKAYKCQANKWTIGYGTTSGVYPSMIITEEQAEQFLINDLKKFERYLNGYINKYNLIFTQNQYDALISFLYNVGSFNGKNLNKAIISNVHTNIIYWIGKYTKVKKKYNKGLKNRRRKEIKLYLTTQ